MQQCSATYETHETYVQTYELMSPTSETHVICECAGLPTIASKKKHCTAVRSTLDLIPRVRASLFVSLSAAECASTSVLEFVPASTAVSLWVRIYLCVCVPLCIRLSASSCASMRVLCVPVRCVRGCQPRSAATSLAVCLFLSGAATVPVFRYLQGVLFGVLSGTFS